MKHPLVSTYVGLILLLLASPSWASRQALGPDALLSSGDRYRQEQALQNALEYNKTGHGAAWINPETGHNGRVTPILTYKNSVGQDCRKYDRSLTIDGRAAVGRSTRCRTRNGVWKVPRPNYTQRYYDPPYYPRPYYPYYLSPIYPFAIYLGYYYGHYLGHYAYRSGHHGYRNRGRGRRHGGNRHQGRRGRRR